MSLEDADWVGAVISAVRAGAGASADSRSLVAGIYACPEIDLSEALDPDDDDFLEAIFEVVSPAWEALGVLDEESRLTALGAWALPRALALGLDGAFDDDR